MSTNKVENATKAALDALQERLFDASAALRCLSRLLEAEGHEDEGRVANAVSEQVSRIATDFDEVPHA